MTGLIINRDCVICSGRQKNLLYHQNFSRLSVGSIMDGYDVVTCQDCGFSFADNIPDQATFDAYYQEMSKYEHQDNAGLASEFETRQYPELVRLLSRYVTNPEARILEIGCANGGLLYEFKQIGYPNILGIDPSPICSQYAERLYQVQVITSPLSKIKSDLGSYDLIILVAVLEHIHDLDDTITKVRDLLSPVGKVYIEVPDAIQFANSVDAPYQEFSIEHINFFSPQTLKNMMGRYGFREVFSVRKEYQQTDTHKGYTIRMMFEKSDLGKHFLIIKDRKIQSKLKKYISVSEKLERSINKTINELVDCHLPLVVWGTGTLTQRLLANTRLSKANIVAFVDSNPNYQGKQLNGLPIISPTQLSSIPDPILVSSKIFQSEIIHQIRSDLKLNNPIFTLFEG